MNFQQLSLDKQFLSYIKSLNLWGDGGIGRRVGLRNQYGNM